MSNATVIRDAPAEPDFLGAHEIGAAYEALSAGDKLKLDAVETVLRRGTEFGPQELLHEAMCRALLGRRNCPRDVPFMAFLIESMKSIASHARERRHRSPSLAAVPRHGRAIEGPPDCASDGLNPEEHLLEKEAAGTVETIHGLFEDDGEAQLVVLGWAEGLRGKPLRNSAGLDQAGLDYAGKRIRKRMKTLYPDGWIS